MKTSDQINEVATALSKAQREMKAAEKNCENTYFHSKYADLSAVWEAVRQPMTSNGLCIMQDAQTTQAGLSVTTRVAHTSGQWVEFGPFEVPLVKRDAHSVGSATSYAKRYALSAAVGVVCEADDDGNLAKASGGGQQAQTPQRQQTDTSSKFISDKQLKLLQSVIGKNEDYRQNLKKGLESRGVKSFAEIPKDWFQAVLDEARQFCKDIQNG